MASKARTGTMAKWLDAKATVYKYESASDGAGGFIPSRVQVATDIPCRLSAPSGSELIIAQQSITRQVKVLYVFPDDESVRVGYEIEVAGKTWEVQTPEGEPSIPIYRKFGLIRDVVVGEV